MNRRIYIHAPRLPNTIRSLRYIVERLPAGQPVVVCHSPGFGNELRTGMARSDFAYRELGAGPERFEYPTLREMWLDSQKDDFAALYLHAKGSSKTSETDLTNAEAWMRWMFEGVGDVDTCAKHLEAGADIVGSQFHWHFKGNFWWARSDYLRRMPDPNTIGADRWNGEYWNTWGLWQSGWPKPRVKNLFYAKGLGDDDDFTGITDVTRERIFVDRRIDPTQSTETIEDLVARKYYCTFSRVEILRGTPRSLYADWLNYDATVVEVAPTSRAAQRSTSTSR
jgi:hypothetical protein